jgi:Protein of unknown function (DUF1194)
MARIIPAAIAAGLLVMPTGERAIAQERQRSVAIELVFAVDISASVDEAEYRLQMQGIANALRQPKIIDAILQHNEGIAVAIIQWAERAKARPDPPWYLLRDRVSIYRFASAIESINRPDVGPLTAVGDAIDYAVELIETNRFNGRRRKIDVSGDGQANAGTPAALARDRALSKGITINGLAILTDQPKLVEYYSKNVIVGPNAFVLQAASYRDFYEAMKRKLLRELTLAVTLNEARPRPQTAAQLQVPRAELARRSD